MLLTNDDGIEAEGLQTLRRALLALADVELAVIAPDGNRSAMARTITTRRPLWVQEVDFDDGTTGYATDGTPVDCVRLAKLGLIDGFEPDVVVSGINHGSNLGDDITYSGTVAAALEGIILGHPGRSPSPSSRRPARWTSASAASSTSRSRPSSSPRVVGRARRRAAAEGTLLNVNVPAGEPEGVEVTRLGKRIYRDELKLDTEDEDGAAATGSTAPTRASTTSRAPTSPRSHAGRIAVTPLHFDLTDVAGMDALGRYDLARLLAPAAREVE